ncbi:MAG TPA: hypothetical protein PLS69_00505 [Terricaulis sp.]|nr:hypothetical protein [Terricaulis sp.]
MRELLLWGVVIAAGLWFFFGGGRELLAASEPAAYDAPARAPLSAQIDLEITSQRRDRSNIVSIDLRADNRSDRWVKVFVDCRFYDAAGAIVGDTRGLISGVAPGASGQTTARWAARGQATARTECRVSDAFEER